MMVVWMEDGKLVVICQRTVNATDKRVTVPRNLNNCQAEVYIAKFQAFIKTYIASCVKKSHYSIFNVYSLK